MASIIVPFGKKTKKKNEALTKFINAKLGRGDFKSIEIFPDEDFFLVKFIIDDKNVSEKIIIADMPKNIKGHLQNLLKNKLNDPSYYMSLLESFFKDNGDKLQEELYLYYSSICEGLSLNLSSINNINLIYKNKLDMIFKRGIILNFYNAERLYDNNYEISFDRIFEFLSEAINESMPSFVKEINKNTKKQIIMEEINFIEDEVIEKLQKEKIFDGWDWNEETISINIDSFQFKHCINVHKFYDEKDIKFIETKINSMGIKDYDLKDPSETELINNICKKILKSLENKKIYCAKKQLEKQFSKYYDEYNKEVKSYLHGERKLEFMEFRYILFPDSKNMYLDCDLFNYKSNGEKEKIVFTEKYLKVMKYVDMKKYQSCKEYVKNYIEEHHINIEYLSGEGFLFGKTNVRLRIDGMDGFIEKEVNVPFFKDSVVDWRKQLDIVLKEMISEHRVSFENKRRKFMEDYSEFIGHLISKEIINFVHKNDRYVTENMIVSGVRNRKTRASHEPTYTENCGCFYMYSTEEVEKIIEKMVSRKVLTKHKLSGDYGDFYIYKPNYSLIKDLLKTYPYDIKDILKKVKKKQLLNDDEAFCYLDYINKKESKTINDYLSLFDLIKLKGFSIVYRDDLIGSFKGAPLELEALIKMKIKTEEIAEYRKIYREINKIIIG